MDTLERMVEKLVTNNARHRKGFRLQEISLANLLGQLKDEVSELSDAALIPEPRENQVLEFGDVYGILLHLQSRLAITTSEIERAGIEKLHQRFLDGVPHASEFEPLKEPLTREQIQARLNNDSMMVCFVAVDLEDVINHTYADFLDLLSQKAVGNDLLADISYRLVGIQDQTTMIVMVCGDPQHALEVYKGAQSMSPECTCIENTNDDSAGHEEYCPRFGLRD